MTFNGTYLFIYFTILLSLLSALHWLFTSEFPLSADLFCAEQGKDLFEGFDAKKKQKREIDVNSKCKSINL